MMYGNCTSKKELLQFIDQVSFAIDDLLLFWIRIQKKKELLNITVSFQQEEMSFWKNMQNFMDR